MLDKQYESSVCSVPPNFISESGGDIGSERLPNLGEGWEKKRNRVPARMIETFLFKTERAGATCSQKQRRHAHRGEDGGCLSCSQ